MPFPYLTLAPGDWAGWDEPGLSGDGYGDGLPGVYGVILGFTREDDATVTAVLLAPFDDGDTIVFRRARDLTPVTVDQAVEHVEIRGVEEIRAYNQPLSLASRVLAAIQEGRISRD